MSKLLRILVVVLAGAGRPAGAYTYSQVGVDSNLLIDEGRVIFAQSDGSLTALDLDTGQVLQRDKSRYYSGTFERNAHGILMLRYGAIAFLNPTNLAVIWETESHYEANVMSNAVVSYDGYGLVECRSMDDGFVRWTYELPGALQVIAAEGRVLVHRAATYEDQVPTILAMLDLDNGQELFRKSPPAGIHWPEVFFDGQRIYVEQGSYALKRSDHRFETMEIWDTRGNEVRSIPIGPQLQSDLRRGGSWFELEGRTFHKGRVHPDRQSIQNPEFGRQVATSDSTNGVAKLAYELSDGSLFIEHRGRGRDSEHPGPEIELRTPDGTWIGELPYLTDRGRVATIAMAPGKLLIGSDLGHVECVNAATGESQWLYVFPTLRHTMSYSSHGMPPMMSKAALLFRQENRNPPQSGLRVSGESARPTRVLLDPQPANPYAKLPLLLTVCWLGAVIPLLGIVLFHTHPRTRQSNNGFTSLALVAVMFICFMELGRVSPGSSIALRVAIMAGAAFAIRDAVKCIRRKRWLAGGVILGVALGIVLLMLPVLLRL